MPNVKLARNVNMPEQGAPLYDFFLENGQLAKREYTRYETRESNSACLGTMYAIKAKNRTICKEASKIGHVICHHYWTFDPDPDAALAALQADSEKTEKNGKPAKPGRPKRREQTMPLEYDPNRMYQYHDTPIHQFKMEDGHLIHNAYHNYATLRHHSTGKNVYRILAGPKVFCRDEDELDIMKHGFYWSFNGSETDAIAAMRRHTENYIAAREAELAKLLEFKSQLDAAENGLEA